VALPSAFAGKLIPVVVTRPGAPGPGGDSGTPTAVATLNAVFQASSDVVIQVDGVEIPIESVFWLDDTVAGAVVRELDLVSWTDELGRAMTKEVQRVTPRKGIGDRLSHIRLEAA